jgi:NTP pyrophosphatase (non-canonical NTP hydrolase)
MEKLSFEELREANKARDNDFGNELLKNSLEHWALKLVNEIGEYGGGVEKAERPKDNSTRKNITPAELGKELADIVILADLNAQKLGLNLAECIIQKFNEKSDKINSKVKLLYAQEVIVWDQLSYNEKEELRKKRPETWRKLYNEKFGQ